MNIYLPIISNIIILAALIIGLFVGRKNGWATQLLKLGFVVVSGVGAYFLAPVIAGLFMKIELIASMMSIESVTAISFSLLVLIFYIVLDVIYLIIKAAVKKNKNKNKIKQVKVKSIKVKSIDKKAEKNLKKKEKETKKALKKAEVNKLSKTSKIFGAIFGVIVSILTMFVVLLPFKYVLRDVSTQLPQIEQIQTFYEYTPYGQLDKLVDFGDFIVRGE